MELDPNAIPWVRGSVFPRAYKPFAGQYGQKLLEFYKSKNIAVDEKFIEACKFIDQTEDEILSTTTVTCSQVEKFGVYISTFENLFDIKEETNITFKWGDKKTAFPDLHIFGFCIFMLEKIFAMVKSSSHLSLGDIKEPVRLVMMAESICLKAESYYEEYYSGIAQEIQFIKCHSILNAWYSHMSIFVSIFNNFGLQKVAQIMANASQNIRDNGDKEMAELLSHLANVVDSMGKFEKEDNIGRAVATVNKENDIFFKKLNVFPETAKFVDNLAKEYTTKNEKIYKDFTVVRNDPVLPDGNCKFVSIDIFDKGIKVKSATNHLKEIFKESIKETNAFAEKYSEDIVTQAQNISSSYPFKEQKELHSAIAKFISAKEICTQRFNSLNSLLEECPEYGEIVELKKVMDKQANNAEEETQRCESLITSDPNFQNLKNHDIFKQIERAKEDFNKEAEHIMIEEKYVTRVFDEKEAIEQLNVKKSEFVSNVEKTKDILKEIEKIGDSGKESFDKFRESSKFAIGLLDQCTRGYENILAMIEKCFTL